MGTSRSMSWLGGLFHLPIASGPYSVSAVDVATSATSNSRGVFLRLFYPRKLHSDDGQKRAEVCAESSRWPRWLPELEYATAYMCFKFSKFGKDADRVPALVGRIFRWLAGDPRVPVVENGAVSNGKFPLVVFSPGNGSMRTTYSLMCSEMASRGFVVATIEHSDGSACIARCLNADGSLGWIRSLDPVAYSAGTEMQSFEERRGQNEIRVLECQEAVRLMRRLDDGADLSGIVRPHDPENELDLSSFRGKVDLDSVLLAGHSFGGATVLKALHTDHQFKAGFCFDPWLFPVKHEREKLKAKRIDAQLFLLAYEKFQWKNNLTSMRTFVKDGERELDTNMATLKKASHYTASDLPTVINGSWIKTVMSIMGWFTRKSATAADPDAVSDERALEISTELFSAFAKSSEELAEELDRSRRHLKWGTHYLD